MCSWRSCVSCDDVLLSVLAVARGPLFKADASEGKAAAAQPFLLSPSSRCSIGLCREEMPASPNDDGACLLLSYSLSFDGTWSSRTQGSNSLGFQHRVPQTPGSNIEFPNPGFELPGGRGRTRTRGSSIEFPKPRVGTWSSRTQGSNSLGEARGSNMEFSKPRVRT